MPNLAAGATSWLISYGFSGAAAAAIVQIGGSILLNAAANALLGGNRGQPDVLRELAQNTEVPQWRFAYGSTRAAGTPIGYPVKGEYLYGCWLLNSRPSEGGFTLYLDEREVELTGDPYDFSGAGATASNGPFDGHVSVWFGRGDQTAPPELITSEAPHGSGDDDIYWKTTDAAKGLTVVWMRLKAGDSDQINDRWPSFPPAVHVEGEWSKVYDPRDGTTAYKANQALCALDLFRTNPFRPYQDVNLLLDQWKVAADVADESAATKAGTEPRYRVGGTVVFDGSEIYDLSLPLFEAGASQPVRAGGRLGIKPGAYQSAVATITDIEGSAGLDFARHKKPDQLPNEWVVKYVNATRGYESAELAPYPVPGALAADGGVRRVKSIDLSFVTVPTQAMRVRKIMALRAREQRSIRATAFAEALPALAGSTVNVALASPLSAVDGEYVVQSIHPGFDPLGATGGVAMRLPVQLESGSAAIYAYDPAVDEETIEASTWTSTRRRPQAPGAISATTGVTVNTGGTFIPAIDFAAAKSPSSSVLRYEWEWRVSGSAVWQTGGSVSAQSIAAETDVTWRLLPVDPSKAYDTRIKAVGYAASDFVVLTDVETNFDLTGVTAAAGMGAVSFDGTTPAQSNANRLRAYRTATTTFSTSQALGTVFVEPDTPFSEQFTAPSGQAYFWIAPITETGQRGAPSGPFDLTIL